MIKMASKGPLAQQHKPSENVVITSNSETLFDYAALADYTLFKDLPPDLIESILSECPVQQLYKDELLLSSGQENHYLYLLISGQLQVYLDNVDSNFSFVVEPGECIGEMSIIEERRVSAYVIAEQDSRLIVLPEDVFWTKFVRLPIAMRNFLQVLSQRLRKQNQITRQALEQQIRYEHLQKELEAAGKIQANILPKKSPLFPKHPQVDVYASMTPAKEVGGDFFDAFALDNDHIYIAIGDVSGKGMPAALFMVRVITLLRMSISNEATFGSLLPTVNQMLCENNEDCMFVTLFVGVLDVKTGRLSYMNGGHNPPFISRHGGPFEFLEVPRALVLGISERAQYDVAELTLHPGDTLVLYTDGVTEAENSSREFFYTDRTAAVLQKVGHKDMTALVKALQDAVVEFSENMPQSDDITLLALRYQGDSL